ncbi:MAG TPA: hypothetical protein VKA10_02535, partial [Prolixibacteraceae bacterium]|nr:hypothetical protein [Prolixibacteraceae bacterium]
EFRKILQQSIDFAGDDPRKVIVISIPDYSATPFAANLDQERISKDIDAFNRINRQETIFKNAHYINITGISRAAKNNPELIANDGLHPSAEMYRLWVEAIFPIAKQILEN